MQPSMNDESLNRVEQNTRLNNDEYAARLTVLKSRPKAVFLQLDAPCNHDCLFCSRPDAYRHFDLDRYRRLFAEKLDPVLEVAERLNLTGSGELLYLPRIREILAYFNRFRGTEKMFATNGSSLTPKMVDLLAESGNRYVIHVSLHGSTRELHREMAKADTWDLVQRNLAHLHEVRRQCKNITLNYIFVATTRNIEDLPVFVRYAADSGADAVVAYYNFVYRLDQKPLSCYFAQELTNRMIDMAALVGQRHGIRVCLPPKFGQKEYSCGVCGEAWSNVMVNPEGDIITCDAAGDSRETILDKTFEEAWNGPYYTRIRQILANGNDACSGSCSRANPATVNDFRSHFITRGRSPEDLARFLEGT